MALDRETVVRTALRLLDEVGLEGLTLRRLATDLAVQAPALYWHFKNKQALLDEMATTAFADLAAQMPPPTPDTTWRGFAATYARSLRGMFLGYRDGAKVFSGTYLTDTRLFAAMETSLAVFTRAGFAAGDAARCLGTIYSYTVGFAIEEQAIMPRPGERDPAYDPALRDARIDETAAPLAREVGADILGNFEQRFEFGLSLILAGIAQTVARRDD